MSQARQPKRHCVCRSVGRSVGHAFTFSMLTDFSAPAQFITAPAQVNTAPAQPPATEAAVYTALFQLIPTFFFFFFL